MDRYLWRHGADRVGDSSDLQEVGTVSCLPLVRVPELAAQGQLLGAGTATALLYYMATHTCRSVLVGHGSTRECTDAAHAHPQAGASRRGSRAYWVSRQGDRLIVIWRHAVSLGDWRSRSALCPV